MECIRTVLGVQQDLSVPAMASARVNRNRPGLCSVSMMELVGHVKTAREQDVHHNPGLVPGTLFIEDPTYQQESQARKSAGRLLNIIIYYTYIPQLFTR